MIRVVYYLSPAGEKAAGKFFERSAQWREEKAKVKRREFFPEFPSENYMNAKKKPAKREIFLMEFLINYPKKKIIRSGKNDLWWNL